jgi:hypothetical protein
MRYTTLILSILFFTACNYSKPVKQQNKLPENSKAVTTKLLDSLGSVTFSIPNKYDTFFQWANWSDCGKPCAKEEYRFQSKHLPITKESGWMWLGEPKDSIEHFTILHSGWFPFHNNLDTNYIEVLHQHRKQQILSDPEMYKIKFDTIEKINDRYFSIVVIDIYDTLKAVYSKKVSGVSTIKSNAIELKYELLTKKNDSINQNFIENSMILLRTIKLSNGK